jgi:glyoxylase-like metal-dependent hydrolase (beta-lactamase superfamily II)
VGYARCFLFTGDMALAGPIWTHLHDIELKVFVESYRKMLSYFEDFDILMPSHNEPLAEKTLLKDILDAFNEIVEDGGEYTLEERSGLLRYDYNGFNIVGKVSDTYG